MPRQESSVANGGDLGGAFTFSIQTVRVQNQGSSVKCSIGNYWMFLLLYKVQPAMLVIELSLPCDSVLLNLVWRLR